jgi:hypothetical protein
MTGDLPSLVRKCLAQANAHISSIVSSMAT